MQKAFIHITASHKQKESNLRMLPYYIFQVVGLLSDIKNIEFIVLQCTTSIRKKKNRE